MRDPERIDRVLWKLSEVWHEVPDFRFWQLIQALDIPEELHGNDPFFWEDEVWENIFEKSKNNWVGD